MGINPFNQPDVESAKIEARKLTDEYEQKGSLPEEQPFFEGDGVKLFTSDEYARELSADNDSLTSLLTAHLSKIKDGDYFALLAYVEMNAENEELLQGIRRKGARTNTASRRVSGLGRGFYTRPARHIKAGRIAACFCR